MRRFHVIFILLITVIDITSVEAQVERNIISKDGFELKSVVWEQDIKSDVILLLHQCDVDRNMYSNLAKILFSNGFHVITFDYRGIGKSVNSEFNIKEASNKSAEWNKVAQHNTQDLDAVMSFIKEGLESKIASISVLGASCGGSKVLYLAEQYHSEIKAIGFLSSRLSSSAIEKYKKVADKPTLFIAAKGDKRAYIASVDGMKHAKSASSEIITYSGNYHAKSLFSKDPQLEETINRWYLEAINKE